MLKLVNVNAWTHSQEIDVTPHVCRVTFQVTVQKKSPALHLPQSPRMVLQSFLLFSACPWSPDSLPRFSSASSRRPSSSTCIASHHLAPPGILLHTKCIQCSSSFSHAFEPTYSNNSSSAVQHMVKTNKLQTSERVEIYWQLALIVVRAAVLIMVSFVANIRRKYGEAADCLTDLLFRPRMRPGHSVVKRPRNPHNRHSHL